VPDKRSEYSNERGRLARVQAAKAAAGGTPRAATVAPEPSCRASAADSARRARRHYNLSRARSSEFRNSGSRSPGGELPPSASTTAAGTCFIWDAPFPPSVGPLKRVGENLVYFQARSQDSPPLARIARSGATSAGSTATTSCNRYCTRSNLRATQCLIDDHSFGQFDVPGIVHRARRFWSRTSRPPAYTTSLTADGQAGRWSVVPEEQRRQLWPARHLCCFAGKIRRSGDRGTSTAIAVVS
jgi:hypothetical protein